MFFVIIIIINIPNQRTHTIRVMSSIYQQIVFREIFENKELKALFDVQKDMDPDDLRALHSMALALKRKERGDIDDTGC